MVSTRQEKKEAERKEKHRLLMRKWRIENPESVLATWERQKRREAANRLERKLAVHHSLHLFLPPKALPKKTVLKCIHFIKEQFCCFEGKMALPIKPMTSNARFDFMTPQAIRMFFPKSGGSTINCAMDSDNNSSVERFFCGSGGLMTSMGPDPQKFRVLPVEGFLGSLLADVLGRVEKLLRARTCHNWDGTVALNTVELKVHCGKDIFGGSNGRTVSFLLSAQTAKLVNMWTANSW